MTDVGEIEVVPATSIVRIDCPTRAAELAQRLAWDTTDAAEIAAALLRGDLVLVQRAPPELDDDDGSAGCPLRDFAATG